MDADRLDSSEKSRDCSLRGCNQMSPRQAPTQSYFQGILHAVFLVMLKSGLSRESVASISGVALATAHQQLRANAFKNPRLSIVVAGVLHVWHNNRRYLGVDGKPRPLSLRGGRRSVAALIRGEDSHVDVSDVIAAMLRLRLIRRGTGGQYRPSKEVATITRLDPVLAEHICQSLGHLLGTVSHNTEGHGNVGQLIERSAQVQDLPRQRLLEFRDFANAQGALFVSTINDWLESRRTGRGIGRGLARAGVHVFAFSEPVPRSTGRRTDAC